MTIALALAFGAVIGILLGLLGGGGSIMAIPALVYALGLDFEQAVLIALIVIAIASAVGAIPKVLIKQVNWRLAGVFAVAGIPATFAGSAIGDRLPQTAIMVGFAVVMIVAGIRMLADADADDTGGACEIAEGGINWRRCAPRSLPVAVVVGLLTGLFGVGGGFLIIPALVIMLGVEMPIAVGTSLLIITANSTAGIASHAQDATINWSLTATFVGTAVVGSLIAGQLGTKLDNTRLQRWFAYLVFIVAAYVLIDTLLLH
ncbi:sulfite exporter TauE/SafE family protein [Mycolicibacterium arseniciresistens]|jgi:uncharacterized membrane protein YfcA|uniref:Probable membrane transporter protein n=1 Tax=Mycolicibacterium arseniciresistens TaxID=3062257 RepID=A0ABT8UB40_9MYCO|nr:sulfite exporter TauE/SafE family protein [Mycolicibacterium arseniciresistens]MDO3635003.1 sulfite exporter TauE/SafE family protein [Mycolicibacterium arseniciresistens]